jgi:hypothetical protein
MAARIKKIKEESILNETFWFTVVDHGKTVYTDILTVDEIINYSLETLYLPSDNHYLDLALYYLRGTGFVLHLP